MSEHELLNKLFPRYSWTPEEYENALKILAKNFSPNVKDTLYKEMLGMKLHEARLVTSEGTEGAANQMLKIIRVSGGFLYIIKDTVTFVPKNIEML